MKKIFLAFTVLITIFVLCSCRAKSNVAGDPLDNVSFESIAKANTRKNLLKKYDKIIETTSNINTLSGDEIIWTLYYEKDKNAPGKANAVIDTGEQYRCYYYNGHIFVSHDSDELLPVITFREKYEDVLDTVLKRDNTLNSAFSIISSKERNKDGGYTISFDYKATYNMLEEFSDWGIKSGQQMRITYTLNNDLEIMQYTYKIVEENNKEKDIINVSVNYNAKNDIPQDVIDLADTSDTVSLTLVENYSSGSQYSESYAIPAGSHIELNSNLYTYYIYTDPQMTKEWDYEDDKVTKNMTLYLSSAAPKQAD